MEIETGISLVTFKKKSAAVSTIEVISKPQIRFKGKAFRALEVVVPSVHEVREHFDARDNTAIGP